MDSSLGARTQESCWASSCNLVHVDSAKQWGASFQYCQQEAIRQWRLRGEGFSSPAWLAAKVSYVCRGPTLLRGPLRLQPASFYKLLSQHLLPTELRPC